MNDLDSMMLRIALGRPQECNEEVSRQGEAQPCDKVAVALRLDPNEGDPYPVCAYHSRADMVPLETIVRFLLDHHEAQRIAIEGLVRMARTTDDRP